MFKLKTKFNEPMILVTDENPLIISVPFAFTTHVFRQATIRVSTSSRYILTLTVDSLIRVSRREMLTSLLTIERLNCNHLW